MVARNRFHEPTWTDPSWRFPSVTARREEVFIAPPIAPAPNSTPFGPLEKSTRSTLYMSCGEYHGKKSREKTVVRPRVRIVFRRLGVMSLNRPELLAP